MSRAEIIADLDKYMRLAADRQEYQSAADMKRIIQRMEEETYSDLPFSHKIMAKVKSREPKTPTLGRYALDLTKEYTQAMIVDTQHPKGRDQHKDEITDITKHPEVVLICLNTDMLIRDSLVNITEALNAQHQANVDRSKE